MICPRLAVTLDDALQCPACELGDEHAHRRVSSGRRSGATTHRPRQLTLRLAGSDHVGAATYGGVARHRMPSDGPAPDVMPGLLRPGAFAVCGHCQQPIRGVLGRRATECSL